MKAVAGLGVLTLLDARPSHAFVATPHYCGDGHEYSPSRNACVNTRKVKRPAAKKKTN